MILRSRAIPALFFSSSIVATVLVAISVATRMATRTMALTTGKAGILRAMTGSHLRLSPMGGRLGKQFEMCRNSRTTCVGGRTRHDHGSQSVLRNTGTSLLDTIQDANSHDKDTLIDNPEGNHTECPVILPGWTVDKAIEESIRRLEAKNVTEPDYSAMYLAAASLRLPWERGIRDLQAGPNSLRSTVLSAEQAQNLEEMVARREAHEPIQYVLGKWDFLYYTIAIRRPLLCPRPETEELVMMIVDEAKTTESPLRILDVGCGTGVIGISLAKLVPDSTVEAIDLEPVAIETSLENAREVLNDGGTDRSGSYRATLCSANDYTPDRPFDVVVSNPPYIPRSDIGTLTDDVTQFESDQALCGGTDGMDVIRTIIEKLPSWCNNDAVCWMEVDPSHPAMIEELLSFPGWEGETGGDDASSTEQRRVRFDCSHKDMFGNDRFVKLSVN
mmetsp:Transcript_23541/g.65345  ORF Transcript_23541/g.65345 Transcript_23541/m.65345 type:complete len:445 (-) Transcript_23541:28-1362(-)